MRRALSLMLLISCGGCQCEGLRPPIPDRDDGGSSAPDSGEDASVADAGAADGGDSGTDGGFTPVDAGAPDASVPAERYCEGILNGWCAHLLLCRRMDSAQAADCAATFGWTCTAAEVVAAVDGGRVRYDERAAASCLADIALSDCGQLTPTPASCGLIFAAATPPGGDCSRQWSGTCVDGYCGGFSCDSTCQRWLPVDAGCSGSIGDECGFEATCRGSPLRCEPKKDAGAPCVPNDECKRGLCNPDLGVCVEFGTQGMDAGCVSPSECQDGLACIEAHCQSRRGITGACRIYGGIQCADDFTCRSFDGGLGGICWPKSDAGEGCYGVPEDCFDGLVCSSSQLFAPGACLGFQSEDAGCDRLVQNCRHGLRCSEASRCSPLPKLGEDCTRDPQNFRLPDCVSGQCAARDGGARCELGLDAGQSCGRPWECASTYCINASCAELCL